MKKKWKRLFWSFLAAGLTIMAVMVILPILFADRIKEALIDELNKNLTTELQVSPDIEVSFIQHFPYASVSFHKVYLTGKGDSLAQNFVHAEELAFYFNPFDIVKGNYTFHSIYLADGSINIFIDEHGKGNYEVVRENPDSLKSNPFLLTIREAVMENIEIHYYSKKENLQLATSFGEMHLTGAFAELDHQLKLYGDGLGLTFTGNSFDQHLEWPYQLDLQLEVLGSKGLTNILPSSIVLADNQFNAEGWYQTAQPDSFAFLVQAGGNDIQSLIHLLPGSVKSRWEGVQASGKYSLDAAWKGEQGDITAQALDLSLDLSKATLKHPSVIQPVTSLSLALQLNKAKGRSFEDANLNLSDISAVFDGLPISGSLNIKGFKNPNINLALDGTVNLSALFPYIREDGLSSLSGKIHFSSLLLAGPLKDLGNPGAGTIESSGIILAEKIKAVHLDIPYRLPFVDISFDGKKVQVDSLRFEIPGSELDFVGTIENLGPYLAQLSGKSPMDKHNLWLNGKLNAEELDIRKIANTFDMSSEQQNKEQTEAKDQLRRIFNLQGNIALKLDLLAFDSMQFNDISGSMTLQKGRIEYDPFTFTAMSGSVTARGAINFWENNSLNINTNIYANALDISEIFRQCGDFGQDALTHKNLSGVVDGDIFLIATWKNYSELDEESLYASNKITISDGRLMNFEPLEKLSERFIIDELSDMQFAEINNTITVNGKKVNIPEMDIKSDDLALKLGGWHGFDNQIDYTFTIGLRHLLAQKFKKDKPDYREYEVEEGAISLPIHMFGHLDDPEIELAWKPIGVAIKEEIKNEKTEWQELLGKAETPKDPNQAEEKHFEDSPLEEIEFIEDDE